MSVRAFRAGVAAAMVTVMTMGLGGAGGVAGATPPVETTGRAEDFGCEPVPGPAGAARVFASLTAQGPDVFIAVWAPGADPEADPPAWQSDESLVVDDVSWNAGVISGTVPLVDAATGEPAGNATIEARVTATGPAEVTTTRAAAREQHNQRVRHTVVVQSVTATVGLVGPGWEFDYTGCPGAVTTVRTWTTQPDASVHRAGSAVFFECAATDASGGSLLVSVEAGDESAVLLEYREAESEEPSLLGFSFESELRRTGVTATVPLFSLPEFDPAGDAVLEASLRRTGHRRFVMTSQDGKKTLAVEDLSVDGVVTLPGGATYSFTGCEGERNTSHEILTDPAGPKPGGTAPGNDGPDGAVTLVAGRPFNDQSKGAAPAAEVPLWCHDDPPPEEQMTGRTLWYAVDGTGGTLAVDTAGSSFNTVVAVYARAGDELVEIACADDVFGQTLQARASFQTDPGKVYLVQVGGYAGQFGHLRVLLS